MLFGTCSCNSSASSISRRDLLCGGGAGFVTALISTLASSSRTIRAQSLSSTPQVHAVIGGFHIVPPLPDDYIHEVIAAFKEINPDYLIPGHCAGERFYDLVRAEMPNKVIRSAVGTRFVFGA
jgi:7,8-dihydropterin-6-yl-methyl-4-(beta-D-ribofuranosyl)aminobenzene 5'-phosphate synthase